MALTGLALALAGCGDAAMAPTARPAGTVVIWETPPTARPARTPTPDLTPSVTPPRGSATVVVEATTALARPAATNPPPAFVPDPLPTWVPPTSPPPPVAPPPAAPASGQPPSAPSQPQPAQPAATPTPKPRGALLNPEPGCEIKGKVLFNGDKVYYRPGVQGYERLAMDTRRGDRWFCSPAEAEEAGWRLPRQ